MAQNRYISVSFSKGIAQNLPRTLLPLPLLSKASNLVVNEEGQLRSRPAIKQLSEAKLPSNAGRPLKLFTRDNQLYAITDKNILSYVAVGTRRPGNNWEDFITRLSNVRRGRRRNMDIKTYPITQKEKDIEHLAFARWTDKYLVFFYTYESLSYSAGTIFYKLWSIPDGRIVGGEQSFSIGSDAIAGLYAYNESDRSLWVGVNTGDWLQALKFNPVTGGQSNYISVVRTQSAITRFRLYKDRVFYYREGVEAIQSAVYNPDATDKYLTGTVVPIREALATARDFRAKSLHDFYEWADFEYRPPEQGSLIEGYKLLWSIQTGFFLLNQNNRLIGHIYGNFTPYTKSNPPRMDYTGSAVQIGTKFYVPILRSGQIEVVNQSAVTDRIVPDGQVRGGGLSVFRPLGLDMVEFDLSSNIPPDVSSLDRQTLISGSLLDWTDGQSVSEFSFAEKPHIRKTSVADYDRWPYSNLDVSLPTLADLQRDQFAEVTVNFEGLISPYLVEGVTFKATATGGPSGGGWDTSATTAKRTLRYSTKISDGTISDSYGGVLSRVYWDNTEKSLIAEFTSAPTTRVVGKDHPQTMFLNGIRYDFQYWDDSTSTLKAYHFRSENPFTLNANYEVKIPKTDIIVSKSDAQIVQSANTDNRNTEIKIDSIRLRKSTEKRIGRVQGVEESLNTARLRLGVLKTDNTIGAVSSALAGVLGITEQMITTYRGRDLPLFGDSTYAETTGSSGREYVPPDAVIDPREGSYKFRYYGRSNVWTFESTDVSVPTPSYIYVNGVRIARTASNRGSSPHSFTFGNVPSGSKGNAGTFNLNVEFSGGRLLFNTPTTRINTSLGTLASTRITGTSADLSGLEYTASDKLYIYFSGAKTAYSNSGALDSVIRTLLKGWTFSLGDNEYVFNIPSSFPVSQSLSDTNNNYIRYEITPLPSQLEDIVTDGSAQSGSNLNILFTKKETVSFEEIDTELQPAVLSAVYSGFDENNEAKELDVTQINPNSVFFLGTDRNITGSYFYSDRTFIKIKGDVATNNYYYFATEDNPLPIDRALFNFSNVNENLIFRYPLIQVTPNVSLEQTLSAEVYNYKCQFKWLDENGLEHRSQFSDIIQLVSNSPMGQTGNQPTFAVQHLNLTNKPIASVGIEIYRTKSLANTFQLLKEIPSSANAMETIITDDVEDGMLAGPAGADQVLVSTAKHITIYRGRFVLWGFPEKPNRVLVSSPRRPFNNKATSFDNAGLGGDSIELLMQSPVTCCEQMDSFLMIFCEDQAYSWEVREDSLEQSNPSPVTGLSRFTAQNRASTLQTTQGVIFSAPNGLGVHLVSRGLSWNFIGEPVKVATTKGRALGFLQKKNSDDIVFLKDTNTDDPNQPKVLVWNQRYGSWSSYSETNWLSAVNWNNKMTILTDASEIFQETEDKRDSGEDFEIETGWISFGQAYQGFKRIREIYLLAEFEGLESLTMSFDYDYIDGNQLESINGRVTSGMFNIAGTNIPVANLREFRFQPRTQQCSAIRIKIVATAKSAKFDALRFGGDWGQAISGQQYIRGPVANTGP